MQFDHFHYPTNFELIQIPRYYGNEPYYKFDANDVHKSIHHHKKDHYWDKINLIKFSFPRLHLRIDNNRIGITITIWWWTLSSITTIEIITGHDDRIS